MSSESFVASRGQTPSVTKSPRFNAVQDLEETASELDGTSSRNDQRWLRRACLERDGEKCVVSNFYDQSEAEKIPKRRKKGLVAAIINVARILPFSIGNSVVRCYK